MSAPVRWTVSTTDDVRAMASQAGVPASALRAAGVDRTSTVVGEVWAVTKGEAITRARGAFPRIPVTALTVTRAESEA